MQYDPIKDKIGALIGAIPWRRRLFYRLLDLVFLRAWYVHRALKPLLHDLSRGASRVRVLDAGSGFGQYTYHLVKQFPRVEITAVDVKTDYLETCRKFFAREGLADRVEWIEADLTNADVYPFDQTDAFDLVLSVDVMEHIEEDRVALQNMARVLRPGGYVVLNTPSDQGGSAVTAEGEQSFIEEHAREGYNLQELEEKLRGAGLKPVASRYAYGPYGSIAWRLLIQGPMKMLSVSRAAALLLPLYYLPVFPIGMFLHAIDVRRENTTGTGLTVVARKASAVD